MRDVYENSDNYRFVAAFVYYRVTFPHTEITSCQNAEIDFHFVAIQ